MLIILQQVSNAIVVIDDSVEKKIWVWLVCYVCIQNNDLIDYKHKISKLCDVLYSKKILSIWTDRIEKTLNEINWEVLFVSNFTIWWNLFNWSKVDFWSSANFSDSKKIYEYLLTSANSKWIKFETWKFWSLMNIRSNVVWPVNYVISL